jgi:ATP-binding cassette subfamily G (WHITE) protein 2
MSINNDSDKITKAAVGINVSFDKLSYSVPIQKDETLTILNELSGSFVPGKLTALMGPSGSGKTTLMDCLAGRKNSGARVGQVLFNGQVPSTRDIKFIVGYVEQFDTLVGELTVEDMLRYTAELKLPGDTSQDDRMARVEEVIRMLNLESCRSTVIGSSLSRGISGGQAKRVNIGLALITRPPVLFLDEPTSGLDSRTANEVVELLKELAHEGNRTIVCTIHSPSGHAFNLFDELHMIHEGQTTYDGPIPGVQDFFEKEGHTRDSDASLPEWLVDLTSGMESIQKRRSTAIDAGSDSGTKDTKSTHFVDLYQSSELKVRKEKERESMVNTLKEGPAIDHKALHQPPSEFRKLITLLKYRAAAHYQDAEFLGPRFGDKLLFALLILSLYFGIGKELDSQSVASTSTLLFFTCALCGYGAAAFVPSLNLERKLFYRELADGCYAPTTYYFSKFIEEAFIALFSSGLFSVIVYFGVALTGNFGIFFITYYLTTLIGVILAYAISAAVPTL